MPILALQRQMREIGRIRTGNQVVGKGGRRVPNKLSTFRLTSPAPEGIAAAAHAYGGVMGRWQNGDVLEYEVITETPVMDIAVPPGQSVSQWMELWSGGGCLRRCDSVTNVLDDTPCGSHPSYVGEHHDKVIPPCPQDVAARVEAASKGLACKTTTRLNVILPQLPDLGVWRLESHSYFAAVHLAGAAEILQMATDRGMLIPARLRLVEGSKKVPGQPTHTWYEPVIEFVETRFTELGIVGTTAAPQLAPGRLATPALPAIAAPAASDFRAPAPPEDVIEGIATVVGGGCGWAMRPKGAPDDGSADVPCTFDEMHPNDHSWRDQAIQTGGRVIRPAE